MRKYICFFLIFLLLIPAATADGVAIIQVDKDLWNIRPENQQVAAINYENGYENMLISVSLDDADKDNRTIWLFPVPAKPESVSIDILKGYPQYAGVNLDGKVRENIAAIAAVSAIYGTFPASIPVYMFGRITGFSTVQKAQETVSTSVGSVVVHEHIEKMGLTTELITAGDSASIRDYAARKGFGLPAGTRGVLDEYIGKDYSFVISYASNLTPSADRYLPDGTPETGTNFVGVFVRFPTDRIYFPLRPTSVYGSRTIPVLIYVTGFVTPLPDGMIQPLTETSYLIDDGYWYYYSSAELAKFFNDPKEFRPMKYTKIRIDAPSEYFTSDLWINPNPPADVAIKDTLVQYPVLWGVLFYIIISVLASLAAGIVVFGTNPAYRRPLAIHGLWNCGSMIGFMVGTIEYMKVPVTGRRQKFGFFLLFYAIFLALCVIAIVVAGPSALPGLSGMAEFLLILPVIGFFFGIHFFTVSPVLSIAAIGLNAALYIVAVLTVREYLK
jgi:hypothetical protein